MNKDKVYIEGYEIDTKVSSLGYREKKIQLMNGKIVIIDENFTHKSIAPQKVKVPQCVADWYEYCKFTHINLQQALIVGDVYFYNYANQKDFSKLKEFLETENNQATFARAWLNGYEVEKEKRYRVKIKGNIKENMLVYGELLERYYFTKSLSLDNAIYSHTRKELEDAGFGWVFDCPGIEIEEVE